MCKFCGKSAGWFSDCHDSCLAASTAGGDEISSVVTSAVEQVDRGNAPDIQGAVDQIVSANRVSEAMKNAAILSSWSMSASDLALREPLSPAKYKALRGLYTQMGCTDQQLKNTDGFRASSMSCLLWSIVNDQPEGYANVMVSQNPFNLRNGEIAIVFFGSVVYSQETSTKSYEGGYRGLSVRVLPGVYSHFGGFKGHPVETLAMKEIDYGGMLLTTESIYFGGDHTTFRIPLDCILSFRALPDGIGLSRSSGHGIPEVFRIMIPDSDGNATQAPAAFGWFLFNATHFLASKVVA